MVSERAESQSWIDQDTTGIRDWPTARLLVAAARLAEHSFGTAVAEHDVTPAGIAVLHCLRDGPLNQHELARRCHVQDQTMSRTLETLSRAGHVTRQRDPEDARRHQVSVTARGARTLASLEDRTGETHRSLTERMSALDRPGVREALLDLIAALSSERPAKPGD